MEDQTTFELYDKIYALESQVNALETQVHQQDKLIQTFKTGAAGLPLTNLLSHNFLVRAFAVLGHYIVAQLILALIIGVGGMCLSMLLAGSLFALFD